MSIKIKNLIADTGWNKLSELNLDSLNSPNPFLSYSFFQSLEEAQCIGENSGWQPLYIEDEGKSLLFSFIKNQSYGEYIFDWAWADFYHRHHVPYYPKLTSMIPFTSVTTEHFLGDWSQKVMEEYEKIYHENKFSSSHFLFLQEKEISFFKTYDYLIRDSYQYHFHNEGYQDFEDFLAHLKNKKAKQIRKERLFDENIEISQFTGDNLNQEHASSMFQFYMSTLENKNAIPYLNKEFFLLVFDKLKKNILYCQATKHGSPIGGALYFFNSHRLYGRYWGASEDVPNLHFELCYYQGIDFCLKQKIFIFEAGAQGEHKIARGFRPVKTYSAHKFKNLEFHRVIKNYIEKERLQIDQILIELSSGLPFKNLET
ncbi:MAG: peptidogalycan biosysnthesis protein [Bacteriovoracaceae bacterium]|nr:peptidogalycan biosysnthesis protein [Bacteriovoracaceae bacterium]